MADWSYTDAISPERESELRSWKIFDDVAKSVASGSVEEFWWEEAKSLELRGCFRASFTIRVSHRTCDAFFNAPAGYRAQYARSATAGEGVNRRLLRALEEPLLRAIDGDGQVASEAVRASLNAVDAKIWIVETEVEEQLSGPEAIANPVWEFHSQDKQGLRAPVGTLLEVKGGWLDANGMEKRNSLKANRSLHICQRGYS